MKKIKATSIVESLIAIVLIVIVFGIGMRSYLNVTNSTNLIVENRAALVLRQIAERTKATKQYIDQNFEEQGFNIQQQIRPYENYKKIYLLELKAFDPNQKTCGDYKELLYLNQNNK